MSQEDIDDMDEFIQGTVLKDYPDMNQSNEESHLTPMLVSGEVSRKRPSSDKQSNQVCLLLNLCYFIYFIYIKYYGNYKLFCFFLISAYEEVKKKLSEWYKTRLVEVMDLLHLSWLDHLKTTIFN